MSLLHPGLEAFIAVIEHSTVHGAAREIGLTQTGVTQRIRTLERQLGTTLFTRSRKGMHPTPEGKALHRYCQSVKDLEGQFLSFLRPNGESAKVRVNICGPSSIMRCRIIPAALNVIEAHPNITLTFNLDDESDLLGQLKAGTAQIAVLERHEVVNELDSKLLSPAQLILVGPPSWADREITDIISSERIVDFSQNDNATYKLLEKYGLRNHCQKERHLANNIDALADVVARGHGYTVLTRAFAQPLIDSGQLMELAPDLNMTIEYALAWYPRHEMPQYFNQLIRAIK